jgi:hypothetical protein
VPISRQLTGVERAARFFGMSSRQLADVKPIATKPLSAAAVKAYRERLAARNLREAAQKRPPIV